MGFDPITLAMAKAYTDEKISGGGSGGGLAVIDISTQPGVEPALLTAEETAQIEAAYEKYPAIVANLIFGEMPLPILCTRVPAAVGYSGVIAQGSLVIGVEDGAGVIVAV